MAFDPKKIREDAKKNWQRTWIESAKLIPQESGVDYSGGEGRAHPIHELVQKTRKVFLELGFDEVENPVFISEEDVYKQYGPEAPVILDRVYYLAGLPRPDIGLSQAKMQEVKAVADVSDEALKGVFREYREGVIEGDNMLEEMTKRLKVSAEQAAQIIGLFPEFRNITPVAGKTTLRSHMTGAWFPTIAAMKHGKLPLKLFSVGLRFRREQKVDSTHLRAHYGGSMVVVDENMSLKSGMTLTEKILNKLEFGNIRFVKKKATSNYYAPDTEYEVYSGDIEVADAGMYSPVALANYDIPYPVFNLGFGLERILMVRNKIGDVRELLYPQFYQVVDFSDEELAGQVCVSRKPSTHEGVLLAEAIKKTALKNATQASPCSFEAYRGVLSGKKMVASVVERESGSRLLGPAASNSIYVKDGSVYGLPDDTSKLKNNMKAVKETGVRLDFNFMDALSDYVAAEVEDRIRAGNTEGFVQVKMAKTAADVNISVSDQARRFITSKNKVISLKGPVFMAVEFKVL